MPERAHPIGMSAGSTFGEASMVDMHQLHKDWYDWTLKGGQKPAFLKQRVAYYSPRLQ